MTRVGTGAPIHLVVPGPIDTLTGGFIYDRRIAHVLGEIDRLGDVCCLDDGFPDPDAAALNLAKGALRTLPEDGAVVVDGLALAALAGSRCLPKDPSRVIALIHHPLCDETGLTGQRERALFEAERAALSLVRGCIVTGPATAARLGDFGVTGDRVHVVTPGLDLPSTISCPSRGADKMVRLLCVATLSPRKGQDVLVRALARLRDLDWWLDLVGAARDPDFAARIAAMVEELGLTEQVTLRGEADGAALDAFYRTADIFVLPSRHEGFGMVLAEAMAHGLPVVSTTAGAIPDTVPDGCGVLVAPEDVSGLATALDHVITSPADRMRLGTAARGHAKTFPTWRGSGEAFARAVDSLVAGS